MIDHPTDGFTEKEMQLALFQFMEDRGRTLILPNFSPRGWREADLFSLTKALYWHEIEIKVSRSDFRADFRNKIHKHKAMAGECEYLWKWMPRTFCFATPRNMIQPEDIPEYAGLIWVDRQDKGFENRWTGYRCEIVTKPPALPARRMEPEAVFKITNNVWFRFAREWKSRIKEHLE